VTYDDYGTLVYVGSWDNYVYALNGDTGAIVWKVPTNGQVWSRYVYAALLLWLTTF
jgi:outer membrane protein assembly factor BamB